MDLRSLIWFHPAVLNRKQNDKLGKFTFFLHANDEEGVEFVIQIPVT
jgi:hypothetical protein